MKPVLKAILFVLLLATILTGLGSAIFIGFGALLTRWLPLSLFQASAVAVGATIALAAIIHIVFDILQFHRATLYDKLEEEEEDDDFDPDTSDGDIPFPEPDFSKVGKNDYCPCGSGRKFKNCCGNVAVRQP